MSAKPLRLYARDAFRRHSVGAGYVAVFAGPAATLPFSSLWLLQQGWGASEITSLSGGILCARVLLSLVLGAWAQRFSSLAAPVCWLCAISTVFGLCLVADGGVHGGRAIVAWAGLSLAVGACTPLLDARNLATGGRGPSFCGARAAGSAAYLVGSLTCGWLAFRYGVGQVIPLWATGGAAVAAALMFSLHRQSGSAALFVTPPVRPTGGGKQMAGRTRFARVILLLGAAALVQASHSLNTLAMIGWRDQGYDTAVCGMVWQVGVACDILLLWGLSRIPIRPEILLAGGALAAAIRWAGAASAPSLWVLLPLQGLHALSSTGTYIATCQLVDQLVPERRRILAQVLSWAVLSGLAKGVATLLVGPAYDAFGFGAFWLMSLLGLSGFGLALALVAALRRGARCRSAARRSETPNSGARHVNIIHYDI